MFCKSHGPQPCPCLIIHVRSDELPRKHLPGRARILMLHSNHTHKECFITSSAQGGIRTHTVTILNRSPPAVGLLGLNGGRTNLSGWEMEGTQQAPITLPLSERSLQSAGLSINIEDAM